MRVGAGEPAQVGALADAGAGDEEAHRPARRRGRAGGEQGDGGRGQGQDSGVSASQGPFGSVGWRALGGIPARACLGMFPALPATRRRPASPVAASPASARRVHDSCIRSHTADRQPAPCAALSPPPRPCTDATHARRHDPLACQATLRPRAGRSARDAAEKNRPLVDDIRLLGRILGDVIRDQEGKAAFELVERVRQLSVAYRLKSDANAGRALDRLLKNLSGDQTVSVIRAFSYFSHLANIAEDRHHVRRRDHHERQGHLQEGSLAMTLERLAARRHPRRRHREDAGARLHLAGAHRAPDRGAAQEHPRRRARDRRADRGSATRLRHRARAAPRTRR